MQQNSLPATPPTQQLASSSAAVSVPPQPQTAKRSQRKHGLECPLDTLQIIAIFVYVLFIIGFITIYAVMLRDRTAQIALCVVMGVLALGSIVSYLIVAQWVADDPLISDKEEGERRCSELRFCTICDCYVHPSTKHCMRCNKCVIGFDHHCRWLNNCIGSRNYKAFVTFLGFTWLVMLFNLCIGIYHMVQYLAHRDAFNAQLLSIYDTLDAKDQQGIFSAIVILVVLNFLAFGLLSHLVGIHIILTVDGVTTYQRILNLRAEAVDELQERDNIGMPAKCWHSSCHGLAVWCYTKGCTGPKPVRGVAPEGKYQESGTALDMTPERGDGSTSMTQFGRNGLGAGGYEDEVNADSRKSHAQPNPVFSIEMTPTPMPADDDSPTEENNGLSRRPLDLGDVGGQNNGVGGTHNTEHPAFAPVRDS